MTNTPPVLIVEIAQAQAIRTYGTDSFIGAHPEALAAGLRPHSIGYGVYLTSFLNACEALAIGGSDGLPDNA